MIRMMQSYSKVHQWGENNLEVEIELFTLSSSRPVSEGYTLVENS